MNITDVKRAAFIVHGIAVWSLTFGAIILYLFFEMSGFESATRVPSFKISFFDEWIYYDLSLGDLSKWMTLENMATIGWHNVYVIVPVAVLITYIYAKFLFGRWEHNYLSASKRIKYQYSYMLLPFIVVAPYRYLKHDSIYTLLETHGNL